ncbi:exocyst complex component EXO70A1-like [Bidens hawaiensis]|uniref:exocyst complex component EXO70A1-like n=1 Tax=Bidens hawaiensis TaxID=980011 RepID=UPI00404B776B
MQPPPPSANDVTAVEKIILRWDSTASGMLFEGDRDEIKRYLIAVDQMLLSIKADTLADDQSTKVNNAIQIAMARLEDEFRNILITNSTPIETESIHESNSVSLTPRTTPRTSSCRSESPEKNKEINNPNSSNNNTSSNETINIARISSASLTDRNERSVTFASIRSMNSIREQDLLPPDCVNDLRTIAERMIAAGYHRECVQVYGSVRKYVVDGTFKKLGVEKLSIGDIQRLEWEALNAKIGRWIRAAKVCIRVLFASEKKLCKQIFEDLVTDLTYLTDHGSGSVKSVKSVKCPEVDDLCFMETVKSPANQLFNFAEAISISRRSPEKLFKILDLYDSLQDLLPDIDDVFDSKLAESVRVQAPEILSRLAEAARGMISEFENAVLREPSRVPVPGGTIHPLARYVMNYISLISDYKQTLGELIVSKPVTGARHCDAAAPDMDFTEYEGQAQSVSPFVLHLIWIITLLLYNLEGKSKHYKDNSLAHLFMMNNVHYIVQKIKGLAELREMIGDHFLRTLTRVFQQAATNHQRATWIGVLHCLRDEGLHSTGSFSSGVSKSALRARFKSFNVIFEEVHRTQALWLVPDEQLREELRISILEKLIPAYRSFLGRFRNHISDNYIKYTVEDLENAVLDLFEGNAVSQHSRRKSH